MKINNSFTGNNSFTVPHQPKRIIVSLGISLFRWTKIPKLIIVSEALIKRLEYKYMSYWSIMKAVEQ